MTEGIGLMKEPQEDFFYRVGVTIVLKALCREQDAGPAIARAVGHLRINRLSTSSGTCRDDHHPRRHGRRLLLGSLTPR